MKNALTWILSLVLVLTISGCFETQVSIDGDSKININDEHLYKAVVEVDERVSVDAYKWEVTTSAGEYRLLNATSSEMIFSASDGGNYTLKVTVTVKGQESTAELMIAVEEVLIINGHVLPPEPDPELNNATLLGIDSNDNGVRDDVERSIYLQFKRPIDQAYLMQYATRHPKVLKDPIAAAESQELQDKWWKLASCWGYLKRQKNRLMPSNSVDFMENAYFNTPERMRAYIKFNQAMSGGSYSIPIHDKDLKAENCDFNITQMLEMEQ